MQREEQPAPPPMRDPGPGSREEKSSEDMDSPPPPQRDPGPMERDSEPAMESGTPDPDPLGIYKGYEYTTPYPTEGYYYYTTTPW